ncbi:MAG: MAPEG family protein [Nevskiaceae bacterium]|nr:MAG: MAPEG family protein [Nevskiaceae bacterium]
MTGLTAVVVYIIWTLLLTGLYALPRIPLVLTGKRRADNWERTKAPSDPAFLIRAKGAHLNCLENLPLFAGLVFVAALLQKSAVVDALAAYVIYARVGQSVAHLLGTSLPLVLVRASLFLAQVVMMLFIAFRLL